MLKAEDDGAQIQGVDSLNSDTFTKMLLLQTPRSESKIFQFAPCRTLHSNLCSLAPSHLIFAILLTSLALTFALVSASLVIVTLRF